MTAVETTRSGWESLSHSGLLLGPKEVAELQRAHAPKPLLPWIVPRLRRELLRLDSGEATPGEFVSWALEKVFGFHGDSGGRWARGGDVPGEWSHVLVTGESLRPRHLWSGPHGAVLPVFVSSDKGRRLGLHRGRKLVSDVAQWLRLVGRPFALLTNGQQWRLIHAGLDHQASCEADTRLWFEEGVPGLQLDGLRLLLQPALFTPPSEGEPAPLLALLRASRRGQSDLSRELGERVRAAVEILVQAHGQALSTREHGASGPEIYRAAVRLVMRLVVLLFAESRELLPLSSPLYHDGYSLRGLFGQLEREAARNKRRLAHRLGAWPRLLSLFRLVHEGAAHEDLSIQAYGGELFAPGDPASTDPVSRALALFETATFDAREEPVSDLAVHQMLELLMRTQVRVRQGRTTTATVMPVDFAGLSSEYIGILYEGLLDYELRPAPSDDPILFLAVGNEPALPLSRLDAMDEKQIKELFKKLKDKSATQNDEAGDEEAESEDEESGEDDDESDLASEDEEEAQEEEGSEEEVAASATEDETAPPAVELARRRALEWAGRAVVWAGLVKKLGAKASPEKLRAHEQAVASKARQLTRQVVLPGQWYLVRWGGTRKGSGTFYTKPQLAVPTVHRTLQPLAYDPPVLEGKAAPEASHESWTPKPPEEILALKVCDPACGSGSFLVAALRYLTEALYRSIFHHKRLEGDLGRPLDEILGLAKKAGSSDTRLPCRPADDNFEERTKALLCRYVAERCLYGVDMDPLATELCRLALWIETLDRDLPFSFLDHKVKCGNSLVGAWFDRFRHYPVMAWARQAGDKSHPTGVHFTPEAETKALSSFLRAKVLPDLVHCLDGALPLPFSGASALSPAKVHDDLRAQLERMHALGPGEGGERKALHSAILSNPEYGRLRQSFDLWCALWFWPAGRLELAPLPSEFGAPRPGTLEVAAEIAQAKRFFHWELEFPDVFSAIDAGFDAVLGNPPWDISKPNSKEWFSNQDPLYRAYGKQEAKRRQRELFTADQAVETEWLSYCDDFKAMSNWVSTVAFPYGEHRVGDESHDLALTSGKRGRGASEESARRHETWARVRSADKGFAGTEHAFRYQGSADINLYKTFLEASQVLLQPDGRLGMITPSGLYTDHGTTELRKLLLDRNRWEWIFGFENRDAIFEIHRSFKFNPILVQKGGRTEQIRTAFMQRSLEKWAPGNAERIAVPYSRAQIERFSPKSRAILEIRSMRDLEVLEKMYANSVLLGDQGPDGWGIRYSTEFHMTNDSHLFPPRTEWEAQGYKPDEYSRWLKGDWRPISELWAKLGISADSRPPAVASPPYSTLPIPRADIPSGHVLSRDCTEWIHEDEVEWKDAEIVEGRSKKKSIRKLRVRAVALPLYEGRMIDQFDSSAKGWVQGKGRSALWREIGWPEKPVEPQYLIGQEHHRADLRFPRVATMAASSSTNQRLMIAASVGSAPCGNSVPILCVPTTEAKFLLLSALNSFAFDYSLRFRVGGIQINWFHLEASPCPILGASGGQLSNIARRLGCTHPPALEDPKSLAACLSDGVVGNSFTIAERLRLRCIVDAVFGLLFGLDVEGFSWILRDCDHPKEKLAIKAFSRSLDPKGFWRVDKKKHPELRQTVLSLVAFAELRRCIDRLGDRERGIAAFCGKADGPYEKEGWSLPETLRLTDYGLGHDDRAKEHQPVASVLGPRFYPWQLAQVPEESWRECELHARNLLGEEGFARLRSRSGEDSRETESTRPPHGEQASLFPSPQATFRWEG